LNLPIKLTKAKAGQTDNRYELGDDSVGGGVWVEMTDVGERLRGFEGKKRVMRIGVGLCYIC